MVKRHLVLLTSLTIATIKGRSGRLMEHYVGNIYNFVTTPPQKKVVIDIPFVEQDPSIITDEVLINIPQESIKPQVLERYNNLYSIKDSILMMQLKHHFTYIVIGFSIPFLKLYGWWIACNDMFVSGIM